MDTQVAAQAPLIAWPSDESLPRFSIRADAGMMLEISINAGVEALPRRGLEVGGLLLGSWSRDEIVVPAIEAVESFYPDGPSYRVTEDELAQALARPRDNQQIVGFYRSRTDGKLELDDQDRLMLRMLATQGPLAILLVRQTKQTAAEAILGISKGGAVTWSEHVVSFSKWLTGTIEAHPFQPPKPASSPSVVVSQPFVPPADVPASGPKQFTPARAVAAGGIAAALLLLITLMPREHEAVAEKSTAASADAPEVSDFPSRASVKVAAAAAHVPPAAATEGLVQRSRSERNVVSERSRTMPVRTFRSPAVPPPNVAAAPSMIVPPPVTSMMPGNAAVPSAVPASIPGPPANAPVPPAAKLNASPAAVQFVPPVLSRQSSPVIVAPDLRRLIQHEVVLSLRVSVDEGGRVTFITPVNRLDRTEQALARSYMSAIQTWRFDPATRNGMPARGETILTFRVIPDLAK